MDEGEWMDSLPDCIFYGHHGPGEEAGTFVCDTCGEECC